MISATIPMRTRAMIDMGINDPLFLLLWKGLIVDQPEPADVTRVCYADEAHCDSTEEWFVYVFTTEKYYFLVMIRRAGTLQKCSHSNFQIRSYRSPSPYVILEDLKPHVLNHTFIKVSNYVLGMNVPGWEEPPQPKIARIPDDIFYPPDLL